MTPGNTRELTDKIFADLDSLPSEIRSLDLDQVELRGQLSEAQRALKNAELDAVINAVIDGKNETERKRQQEQAIQSSPAVQAAQARVDQLQADLAAKDVDIKALSKRWQAAMAMAELQAARLNLMAKYQPKKE